MVPPCSDRISRVPPYSRITSTLRIRGYHPLRPDFPDRSACLLVTTGLFRVRSPLLAESLLMSLPPGTEMFQFPGFASNAYVFSARYPIGVGCPIRISTDQSLLAAPHGFSQRATSFIASWCQGIHPNALLMLENCRDKSTWDPSRTPCTGTIPTSAAQIGRHIRLRADRRKATAQPFTKHTHNADLPVITTGRHRVLIHASERKSRQPNGSLPSTTGSLDRSSTMLAGQTYRPTMRPETHQNLIHN